MVSGILEPWALVASTARTSNAFLLPFLFFPSCIDEREFTFQILYSSISLPIHSSPQNTRALECHHFPWWQNYRLTRLEISASTSMLLFHRKFPEPADENIFTVLQGLFYQLEKSVDYLGR